jgi:hypothetical protein
MLEDGTRNANGIFDMAQTGSGTSAKCGRVHDDGVAFDLAIEIQVGAEASVEDGIVFEDDDGGFDGIEGMAAVREHTPTRAKGAEAARVAGVFGVVRDIPRTAMNDERRSHAEGAG